MPFRPFLSIGILFSLLPVALLAQSKEDLILFNQSIDNAVIIKDTLFLRNVYANDFVFTHGTGLVEGRESWIKALKKNNYLVRKHDSVVVETHRPDVYILYGTLTVKRQSGSGMVQYALNYVRVFQKLKKEIKMLSHRTIKEWHLN